MAKLTLALLNGLIFDLTPLMAYFTDAADKGQKNETRYFTVNGHNLYCVAWLSG